MFWRGIAILFHLRMASDQNRTCQCYDTGAVHIWPSFMFVLTAIKSVVGATHRTNAGHNLWYILLHHGHICQHCSACWYGCHITGESNLCADQRVYLNYTKEKNAILFTNRYQIIQINKLNILFQTGTSWCYFRGCWCVNG